MVVDTTFLAREPSLYSPACTVRTGRKATLACSVSVFGMLGLSGFNGISCVQLSSLINCARNSSSSLSFAVSSLSFAASSLTFAANVARRLQRRRACWDTVVFARCAQIRVRALPQQIPPY
eukprot:COSAG02_NODE_25463_length_658_cov_0.924866_2_plen_120_part_01